MKTLAAQESDGVCVVLPTQRGDDVPQRDQRLVDVPAFLEANPRGSCGVGPLATRQVHQVDLTDRLAGHLGIELGLEENREGLEWEGGEGGLLGGVVN